MSNLFAFLSDFVRGRPVFAVSLFLAVLLGGTNYYLWGKRTELARQHAEVRASGDEILAALTARTQINADLAKLKEAMDVIDKNLVVETDMEVNLGYFYRMERLCRVRLSRLNQLSPLQSPEGNPFKAVPVSLRATGTYAQLMNFLRHLETGPSLLAVRTFSFNRADPKTGTLSLDLTLDMLGRP